MRGYLEVETPAAVVCPGLDPHLAALEVDGLGARRWLATSPEYQMKRLLAAGFPRLVQIARAYRAEEVGPLHEPEFTLLEWYRTGAGSAEMMEETEELVAELAEGSGGRLRRPGSPDVAARPPWERLTVEEAFRRYAGTDLAAVLAAGHDAFFRVLVERVEPRLGWARPTFLVRWPVAFASLARRVPDAPAWADRFEAYVGGIELCNGFGELTDPVEQRERLRADQAARARDGKEVYPIDERFLRALEEGIPPAGGNALGVDRLVMLLVGAAHLDEVRAFGELSL